MKVYENEEQRLVEEEERAEEKEKTAKEAGRRKRGHRRIKLTNNRRTLKKLQRMNWRDYSNNICDRTWEKGPIDVVDHFLFFYTFGTCASLPHYGYLSER